MAVNIETPRRSCREGGRVMGDRYTTVRPLDRDRQGIGLTLYGRHTRAEMLERMRRHYQRQLEDAQYALNARDDEFIVETHTGLFVKRDVTEVEGA